MLGVEWAFSRYFGTTIFGTQNASRRWTHHHEETTKYFFKKN